MKLLLAYINAKSDHDMYHIFKTFNDTEFMAIFL
jgi:hypothetical protein